MAIFFTAGSSSRLSPRFKSKRGRGRNHQHNFAAGIFVISSGDGESCGFQFLGIVRVRREEEIKRRAVLNLLIEIP